MSMKQQGSVIIITLWTIVLLTVLVTVLASQTRLSAKVAYFHKEDLQDWADESAALNQAEMDVMLQRMKRPVEKLDDLDEVNTNPLYRYNGDALELFYPQAQDIDVRIFDHAGKINLREISRPHLRALLEKQLGDDADDQINEMMSAWGDWQDLNDLTGVNGAEKDYYEALDTPYQPRNGRLETVQELLLIRGFNEVFRDVNLDAAFTLYGDDDLINLNLATVDAMRLLPGLDDELIDQIVAWRRDNEFRGNGDVAQIVPAENMAELRPWLNSRKTTNFYTIMVYKDAAGTDGENAEITEKAVPGVAYSEIVQVVSGTVKPRVLKVDPYQRLPELRETTTE